MKEKFNLKKLLGASFFKALAHPSTDFLFYLAAATLPFENLFFAPSSGWATVTPLILFLYAMLNLYYLRPHLNFIKKICLFFLGFGLLSTITVIFFHGRLDDYLAAYVPIVLGLSCLFSFLEFHAKQGGNFKQKFYFLTSIIIISYLVSLLIGLAEYFALKYHLTGISDILAHLFKRNYLAKNRVQFFFTEPSFIGMHLFGILLPLFWLTKRYALLFLIILYSYSAILFGAGVRIILDIFLVILILSFYYLKRSKDRLFTSLVIVALVLFIVSVSAINGRFHKIFFGFLNSSSETSLDCNLEENQNTEECLTFFRQAGVNSDGSFASRLFRIKSTVFGYTKSPVGFFIGYGLGNSIHPARLGHAEAKKKYKSSYMKEVNDLANPKYHDDSVSYCLYTRFVSEFGIFALLIGLFFLINLARKSFLPYKYHYLFIILYLYLQFESLSFYALWLYLAILFLSPKSNKQLVDNSSDKQGATLSSSKPKLNTRKSKRELNA